MVSWLLVAGLSVGLTEALLMAGYQHPRLVPRGPLLEHLRSVYLQRRAIVQFSEACSRYDSDVTYSLRPGRCRFSNVEFDVEIVVNGQGLRDDEASLDAPQIIVLGDSQAMGWGVGQDESFAQVLESALTTGGGDTKVLNAAISSFGTAREMRLLRRLDTSGLRLVILQYSDNDAEENRRFVSNGERLLISSEERYDKEVRSQTIAARGPRAVLLPWLCVTARGLRDRLLGRDAATASEPKIDDPAEEVEWFLSALRSGPPELLRTPVILLEINSYGRNDGKFLRAVAAASSLERHALPPIEILDLSQRLDPIRHHFRLDDHLNAAGHRLVAEELTATRSVLELNGSRATSRD